MNRISIEENLHSSDRLSSILTVRFLIDNKAKKKEMISNYRTVTL
jgi:hypothetical protein